MNPWAKLSIEYANQRTYLDDLFRVYPTIPNDIRSVDLKKWGLVEESFNTADQKGLIENLLNFELFPIKDSYVAFLKRDRGALNRNPKTVNRLAGTLKSMGLNEIYKNCTAPKEANRQMGPMFRTWLEKETLGVPVLPYNDFVEHEGNCVLKGGDAELLRYAKNELGYRGTKGIDLLARFNDKHVIGEAKFLTDFGGHQNAQFNDAITVLEDSSADAIKIAVLDGVLYIDGQTKMRKHLTDHPKQNIMSALVLREYLYQI